MAKKQPEPVEYRPPTNKALQDWGFVPFQVVPNFLPHARAGCSGGTGGIWTFEGYKGSPKIELVYLSHGWFTLGPPESKERPQKYRAANGNEFEAALYAAGYPNKAQRAELDEAHEVKMREKWEADCAFMRMLKRPEPKSPDEEKRILKRWEADCSSAERNKKPKPFKPVFSYI